MASSTSSQKLSQKIELQQFDPQALKAWIKAQALDLGFSDCVIAKPDAQAELERFKEYLKRGKLSVGILNRGTAWLDTGTFASLMQAGQFVQVIEERQGMKIGCIEEVAYRMGYISAEQLETIAKPLVKSGYGQYLLNILR